MNVIDRKQSQVFFVDGPSGTGKTFLSNINDDFEKHYYWVVELHTPDLIYLLMYNQIPSAI